jgi:predicted nucleotidyltransferase
MNIWRILSSKERTEVLQYILEKEVVGVEEIAKTLNRSKGFISQFFKLLEGEGILAKKDRKYAVLLNSPKVRSIKILLNIMSIYTVLIKYRTEWMDSLGIYGGFAKGTNRDDSDIDIWIRVTKHPGEKEVAKVEKNLTVEFGKPVHILILTPEKLERLKKEDQIFYCELSNSFVIWGDGIGF